MSSLNPKFSLSLAWNCSIFSIKRGFSYVLSSVMAPLTLLFLVGMISGGKLLTFAVLGGFVAQIAANTIFSLGEISFWRLELHMQDLFVTSKAGPIDYMLGFMLYYLIFSTPGLALYAIIGALLHIFTIVNVLVLAFVLLMVTLATSSISFVLASRIRHMRNVWGVASVIATATTVIPPTFYPYVLLPKDVLYVLLVIPVTPAVVLLQGVFGLEPLKVPMFYVLVVETIAYFAIARYLTRWREK